MMALVEVWEEREYAVPRDPAPIMRRRGGFGKSCLGTGFRKEVEVLELELPAVEVEVAVLMLVSFEGRG